MVLFGKYAIEIFFPFCGNEKVHSENTVKTGILNLFVWKCFDLLNGLACNWIGNLSKKEKLISIPNYFNSQPYQMPLYLKMSRQMHQKVLLFWIVNFRPALIVALDIFMSNHLTMKVLIWWISMILENNCSIITF